MLSFWADAIVALLLVATIGYSAVLNRRLTAVRSDRDKFEHVVRDLAVASQRAEGAVANLRSTADDLGRRLDKKIDEARALCDDLSYMVERGGNIADRLETQIRAGRDAMKPDLRSESRSAQRAQARTEPRTEHKIEPVLRQPLRSETPRPSPSRGDSVRAEQAAVLAAQPNAVQAPAEPVAATSRAERELLRALSRRR